jgi:hypothetical protein
MADARAAIFPALVNGLNHILCSDSLVDIHTTAQRLLDEAKPILGATSRRIAARTKRVGCPVCHGQGVSQPENAPPDCHGIVRAKPQERCWHCGGEGTVLTLTEGAPNA